MECPAIPTREPSEHQDRRVTDGDWLTAHWERAGDCLVIQVCGEIDYFSAGSLSELVTSAAESSGLWRVVLDLNGVPLCDSSGLGALVGLWKAAKARGGALTLARVPPVCERVLVTTGLRNVLGTWPAVADAITSITPARLAVLSSRRSGPA